MTAVVVTVGIGGLWSRLLLRIPLLLLFQERDLGLEQYL